MMARVAIRGWRAPGRVNLIGDHTDYEDGFCFPLPIDRECRLVASAGDAMIRARSAQLDGNVVVAADGTTDPSALEPRWGRLVAGAVAAIVDAGGRLPACELHVSSSLPIGAGLASSSALSVALVLAGAELGGLALAPEDVATLALDAEVRATSVPGGLMDQLAAVYAEPGHALLLDCRSLTAVPIRIPRSIGVVVVHSGLERALADSAYATRRMECAKAAERLGVATLRDATIADVRDDPRARHVVSENRRVVEFAEAMRTGDVGALGPLMLESHASLRDDFAVSTPELDRTVEWLIDAGAYGARLTGAGFGGCVVALVQRNHADDVLARVVQRARRETGQEPLAFAVQPGQRAGAFTADA